MHYDTYYYGLKQDASSLLFINFGLEFSVTKVKEGLKGLELNGTHHLPVYADDVNLWE
jgi:hypothetical protein